MSAMLFGKLPAHGDFVARGLDADDRAALDGWLAAEMSAARDRLGAEFEGRFDHAPVWRFVWPERARAGAIAPSADRVGRRFPLIAAAQGADEATAAACEEHLYSALVEQWSADTLFAALGAIGTATEPTDPDGARWWSEGNAEFGGGALAGERPMGLLTAMLTTEESHAWD